MDSDKEYTLFAKTVQGGALRSLFECLYHIVHDTNVTWEARDEKGEGGGAKILTMDGARCALIHMRLDADQFDEFYCPGTVVTGINMSSIWKLLKTASSHDTITIFMESETPYELGLVIENAEKNARTQYALKLLDCDSENFNIPDVTFDRVLTLPSVYFQRLCREMTNLGEYMTISIHGSQLQLVCDGTFARQHTSIGESDGCMSVTETTGESVEEAIYSLRYLSLFTRASSLSNVLTLFIKKDFPLVLQYSIANLGTLRFCLATHVTE
jgi:proliferating cell nuclear antigen